MEEAPDVLGVDQAFFAGLLIPSWLGAMAPYFAQRVEKKRISMRVEKMTPFWREPVCPGSGWAGSRLADQPKVERHLPFELVDDGLGQDDPLFRGRVVSRRRFGSGS
jgi:hypothetical protein